MPKIILLFFLVINLNAETLYPSWLRYGLKIVSNFGTQNEIEGYGIIINDGLILTSAQNVYRSSQIEDILLYDGSVLGDHITCLGYAKVLALDMNLDLAILVPSTFTDIYCNLLPVQGNFRSLVFKESFLNLLEETQEFALDKNSNISYMVIGDWLEFQRKTMPLGEFMSLLQIQKESFLGMPVFLNSKEFFVEDFFIGIITGKSHKTILEAKKIVQFLCEVNKKTSIFEEYPSLQENCYAN
ncbi:hypothetical protein [Helicobacter mesocricetorum]|uniref:hypothetical protein n=1 Tax=Helicobacter mesocricetorum TaxID=87012 RepID=UPI000CF0E0CA|nr:hypothetical protein [Helicobacter mesocricetorum]